MKATWLGGPNDGDEVEIPDGLTTITIRVAEDGHPATAYTTTLPITHHNGKHYIHWNES